MTVLSMSRRAEIDRSHVLMDVIAERISSRDAAQLMRVTPRQVFSAVEGLCAGGPSALLSKRRGKPSNRSYPTIVRTEALALIAVDAGRGSMEGAPAASQAGPPAAASARLRRRARSDRRFGALVVRESQSAMHPARFHPESRSKKAPRR